MQISSNAGVWLDLVCHWRKHLRILLVARVWLAHTHWRALHHRVLALHHRVHSLHHWVLGLHHRVLALHHWIHAHARHLVVNVEVAVGNVCVKGLDLR